MPTLANDEGSDAAAGAARLWPWVVFTGREGGGCSSSICVPPFPVTLTHVLNINSFCPSIRAFYVSLLLVLVLVGTIFQFWH